VRYFIEQEKGNGLKTLISVGNQRRKPSTIDAVLVQMDINKLESGNYTLTVELRNAASELLTSRTLSFQRSNPFLNASETELTEEVVSRQFVQNLEEDTLRYGLRAISALAVGVESDMLKTILQTGDLKAMRFYLFRHFMREDPNNPELAYNRYMEVAAAVDQRFRSGFRYGFETDRGRTFLRFGRPDDLVHVEDDPGAPPYEIWVYYKFPQTQQNNVKFLFYNPSLAGEDFILLHSNARGEISNPRWERVLYSRNPTEYVDGDNFHDATGTQRNLGRNAKAYFEDF
jgi:GWxTD domain-containing protein